MIDSKLLLADLQKQVSAVETDLAEQLAAVPEVAALLDAEYEAEKRARRAGNGAFAWRQEQLTQIAVAWVLGTVFLRWSEDNKLIEPVLSGPGERLAQAEDAQLEHYRRHPEHTDADWLAEQFESLRSTDAGKLLFDPEHNPMYWVPVSHDAAKALTAFWRSSDGASLRHDFTDPDWDTRFLGDLYQELSEDAKKRYALLQTPRFVESFILDRTLTPAIEEFGLDGLRLIDPACGSGHFLLGAYERLVEAWKEKSYTIEPYQLAECALASVHGVDTNPFAVAIARFRLMVAALKTAGVTSLRQAASQRWRPLVACTDSLRTLERQESFELVDEAIGYRARWEDIQDFDDQKLLYSGTYHVVVGNPPYIVPKDPDQAEYYRKRWSACHRQYQLSVPFAQRIFDLALRPADDGLGAGYAGQITSNGFMKREFGKKLIEDFLPTVELSYVVDTSGAYIPGHGTPTVILIGRRASSSRRDAVRAVLGVRGEPDQPANPEKGLVWSEIERCVDDVTAQSTWVSVVEMPRSRLRSHPWSLSGGGADELMTVLGRHEPDSRIARVGFYGDTHADDLFTYSPSILNRHSLVDICGQRSRRGDQIRDWMSTGVDIAFHPYGPHRDLLAEREIPRVAKSLFWRWRSTLWGRAAFSGGTYRSDGKNWWEWHQLPKDREAGELAIAFAEISSHNHFFLVEDGSILNRTAPVVKLVRGVTKAEHLELLELLNSSVACFWLKQVCHKKGGSVQSGGGSSDQPWSFSFQFSGGKVRAFPLPPRAVGPRHSFDCSTYEINEERARAVPASIVHDGVPDRQSLVAGRERHDALLGLAVASQEDADWEVYGRYGLLSQAEANAVVWRGERVSVLGGERAFEIVLARAVAAGEADGEWFTRHNCKMITETPRSWPQAYRDVVEARIELIEKRRDIALIERPECKRRWATEPWGRQQERALRGWLLDRLEASQLWFEVDVNGDEQPALRSVSALADLLRTDEDFTSVAALWAGDALGRPDAELGEVIGELVDSEHVPFLAVYRYKPAGLTKRAEWERTWDLQRQEDAVASRLGFDDVSHPGVRDKVLAEVGPVPVPPKSVFEKIKSRV